MRSYHQKKTNFDKHFSFYILDETKKELNKGFLSSLNLSVKSIPRILPNLRTTTSTSKQESRIQQFHTTVKHQCKDSNEFKARTLKLKLGHF